MQGVHYHLHAMQELDLAHEDAKVYKLIGPTLIKQDPVEARSNVNKRLEFINGELSRLDARLTAHQGKASKRQQQVALPHPHMPCLRVAMMEIMMMMTMVACHCGAAGEHVSAATASNHLFLAIVACMQCPTGCMSGKCASVLGRWHAVLLLIPPASDPGTAAGLACSLGVKHRSAEALLMQLKLKMPCRPALFVS